MYVICHPWSVCNVENFALRRAVLKIKDTVFPILRCSIQIWHIDMLRTKINIVYRICFTLCLMFMFHVVLHCNKKLSQLPKLQILDRSILKVRMGKSRPLEKLEKKYTVFIFLKIIDIKH